MTKQEFIALFQNEMGIETKKESERLVAGFISTLETLLAKGDNLSIIGFGKFEVVTQNARTCRNPKTNEVIQVPEKKVVKFRPGKALAEKVNK